MIVTFDEQPTEEDLEHFGIKGMKWGVRRYENEDGSLTSLGKKRQDAKQAKKTYYRLLKNDQYGFKKSTRQARANKEFTENEFKDAKTLEKINNQKHAPARQAKYSEEFQKQGLSKQDADIRAYNKVRTRRLVAAVGAVALASAAAYIGYKHYDRVTDRILEEGSALGRVANDSSKDLRDGFYAFTNSKDREKYVGLLGKSLREKGDVFEKSMKVAEGCIKVASPESARKALSGVLQDEKSKKEFLSTLSSLKSQVGSENSKLGRLADKAIGDVRSGKTTNSVYEAFNIALVDHSEGQQKLNDKFYKVLKDQGYSAIRDVNDKFYSGFNSKNPMIIFDKNRVNVDGAKKLADSIIDEAASSANSRLINRAIATEAAKIGAAVVGFKTVTSTAKTASQNRFVDKYYKEHPGSKLSKNEIIKKMYEPKNK